MVDERDAALERSPAHHAYLAARADLLARGGQCEEASEDVDAAIDSTSGGHGTTRDGIERATASLTSCEQAIANR